MARAVRLGYTLDARDMFKTFPTKKMLMTAKECEKIRGDRHKERLAANIFMRCFFMILEDVIDNNVEFKIPGAPRDMRIRIKAFSGELFKKLRAAGSFKEVDFLKSNFTGYYPYLYIYYPCTIKEKIMNISKNMRDKLIENTNNGVTY